MKFSGLFLHAETFPLQNWISSNTTLRQGLTPLWVGPCFKPWSGVNRNIPRFSLILHLLNTLAFYSALDASLLYVNKINGFFIHFRRILQGWFQSKSVVNYAQRAVALLYHFFAENTRRLRIWLNMSSLSSGISFSLRVKWSMFGPQFQS